MVDCGGEDRSVSMPRVKSPCPHLLDQERSREWAVVVVCVKYDRFSMELLYAFIPGKVDEYKDADLLIQVVVVVRKDCHYFRINLWMPQWYAPCFHPKKKITTMKPVDKFGPYIL